MVKERARKGSAKPVAQEQDIKGTCKLVGFLRWLQCPCQCATDKDSQQSRK